MQVARILAPDDHRERVIKPERGTNREAELFFVGLFHPQINILLVAARLLFENSGQRGARVFRVDIDASGQDRLLTDKCACQVEAALNGQVSASFDQLREEFSENELLGEVLRADDDAAGVIAATHHGQKKPGRQKRATEPCYRTGLGSGIQTRFSFRHRKIIGTRISDEVSLSGVPVVRAESRPRVRAAPPGSPPLELPGC